MKQKGRLAGVIIGLLSFIVFTGFIGMMITPKEKSAGSPNLTISHIEDDDTFTGQPQLELLKVKASCDLDSLRIFLHYYRDGEFLSLPLEHLQGTSYFGGEIPSGELGNRTYYYFEAMDNLANKVLLPSSASKEFVSEYNYFEVRFEGKPTFLLLLLHIVLMLASLIILIHALYYAIFFLQTGESGEKALRSSIVGIVTFFITGFPIGWIIEKQVLGNYWEGIPFGWDITDNKTLLIFLIWLIIIMLKKTDKISLRAFARWVIINTIITFALFLVPHSI